MTRLSVEVLQQEREEVLGNQLGAVQAGEGEV